MILKNGHSLIQLFISFVLFLEFSHVFFTNILNTII